MPLSTVFCLHSKEQYVFLRRAVKISQETNLGLDVGLEVGLGSPTQLSEHSRRRVFYNEPIYFFFGATMEYEGLHYCYVHSLGRFTAMAGTHPEQFFLQECNEAVACAVSQDLCEPSPWEWVLQEGCQAADVAMMPSPLLWLSLFQCLWTSEEFCSFLET